MATTTEATQVVLGDARPFMRYETVQKPKDFLKDLKKDLKNISEL